MTMLMSRGDSPCKHARVAIGDEFWMPSWKSKVRVLEVYEVPASLHAAAHVRVTWSTLEQIERGSKRNPPKPDSQDSPIDAFLCSVVKRPSTVLRVSSGSRHEAVTVPAMPRAIIAEARRIAIDEGWTC